MFFSEMKQIRVIYIHIWRMVLIHLEAHYFSWERFAVEESVFFLLPALMATIIINILIISEQGSSLERVNSNLEYDLRLA